jgi:histidyl-tRNA synthetase
VIVLDPSVVRGLGYYTGAVYEAELTFEITDDKGRPRQFGSVAGGGRYDDLVRRFTGEAVPATGVSIGVDRLLAALAASGRTAEEGRGPRRRHRHGPRPPPEPTRRWPPSSAAPASAPSSSSAAATWPPAQIRRQARRARRVIEGSDEAARGVVQLKDLALGARLAAEIETHEAWKAQPAQVEVPRDRLVEEVRAMLARAAR